MIKLWHDDVRPPPEDDWHWARTNEEAIALLSTGQVTVVSLDHDLGLHEIDSSLPGAINLAGASPEGSGYDLVKWMCETKHLPARIVVHSWNPDGAKRMVARFRDEGCDVEVRPYRL